MIPARLVEQEVGIAVSRDDGWASELRAGHQNDRAGGHGRHGRGRRSCIMPGVKHESMPEIRLARRNLLSVLDIFRGRD